MPGKTKGKQHQRTVDKIKFAVRLMIGCPQLSMTQIAQMVGVNPTRLSIMQRLPLWTQIHTQYLTGVISRLDDKVDDNFSLSKKTLEFAAPLALQTLVQQALNAKDERVRNKACNDILDREGTFTKVSRTSVEIKNPTIVSDKDNEDASELMKALAAQQQASQKIPVSSITDPPITNTEQ